MANFTNTLYPPQVDTFMPAFVGRYSIIDSDDKKNPSVYITFSISPYNDLKDIKRIHVSLVDQKTNSNALNLSTGIMVKRYNYNEDSGLMSVKISASDLIENVSSSSGEQEDDSDSVDNDYNKRWKNNQYYKVQLRFDCVPDKSEVNISKTDNYWDEDEFSNNSVKLQKYLTDNRLSFSEWSTVCLIKPILEPQIMLTAFDSMEEMQIPQWYKGTCNIAGLCYFGDGSNNEKETLQSFSVEIYDEEKTKKIYPNEEKNEESKKYYTGMNPDPNSINLNLDLRSIKDISVEKNYILNLICTTKNQYTFRSKDYKFYISSANDSEFKNSISEFTVNMDDENGRVEVILTFFRSLNNPGIIYIKRASNSDNYSSYETIYCKKIIGNSSIDDMNLSFFDNTVGCYKWYKYTVEFENTKKHITYSPISASNISEGCESSEPIFPQFYDAIISRKEKQLKLQYNYKITSMKNVVNRSKIDTLGGKYPKFAENAQMNYKQFSITGLISAQADENRLFINEKDYFNETGDKNRYDVYLDKNFPIGDNVEYASYEDGKATLVGKKGSTPLDVIEAVNNIEKRQSYNFFWEREFREAVIEWLNDGEPKLYRSMTEGSMVVMITDVSITPDETLSRRLWNFSATVYEVADSDSLDILSSLGIIENTTIEKKYLNEDQSSGGEEYAVLTKVQQMYKKTIDSNLNNKGLLSDYLANSILKPQYFGVLSDKTISNLKMKNIKIYFHNKPHKYLQTSSGLINYDNISTDGLGEDYKRIQLGYVINVTLENGDNAEIFINEKGYYQIPDNIIVKDVSVQQTNDIVTLDYILIYQEIQSNNASATRTTISKTVVGQYSGVFPLDKNLGNKIRLKYNYIKYKSGKEKEFDFIQKMDYWKGISLDVTPYALVDIKYKTSQGIEKDFNRNIVGDTGVLNLLKEYPIYDIKFRGRRMFVKEDSRQDYLKPWECCLDISVKNAVNSDETKLNQYLTNSTNNTINVNINQNNDDILNTSNLYSAVLDGEEELDSSSYKNFNEIKDPRYNTIYYILNKTYIYYIDGEWYDINLDAPINGEIFSAVAKVPIEGMINYYGNILRSEY